MHEKFVTGREGGCKMGIFNVTKYANDPQIQVFFQKRWEGRPHKTPNIRGRSQLENLNEKYDSTSYKITIDFGLCQALFELEMF
jgi:hypothetical protein